MSFLLRSLTSLPKRQLTLPKKQLMVYQQLRGAKMRAQHLEVGPKRRLAYRQVPGQKKPTIVMVPGLHSYLHMQGMTARALLRYFLGGFQVHKLLVFLVFLSFMFNLKPKTQMYLQNYDIGLDMEKHPFILIITIYFIHYDCGLPLRTRIFFKSQ